MTTITQDALKEAEEYFKEKWVRKLMVATLLDMGVTCPGICSHQIPQEVGGRHCGTMSRVLNRGTKSIFRTLWKLADLGYIQILEIPAHESSSRQQRRAIQKCYRLTEKGKKKAKEFEDEFTYEELI
ncbi:MAG: hypothetical protein ACFFCD_13400 [Promethearchaeota archaeon]